MIATNRCARVGRCTAPSLSSPAAAGARQGIVVELGRRGTTVYVAGRTAAAGSHALPGTIHQTAEQITAASGRGIASYHLDPAYGATKAGLDKMTWDMAEDFREYGCRRRLGLARTDQDRACGADAA
jgi:hypothetical protein